MSEETLTQIHVWPSFIGKFTEQVNLIEIPILLFLATNSEVLKGTKERAS